MNTDDSSLARLGAVPTAMTELLVTTIFLIGSLTFVLGSLQYRPGARLFPLLIGVPTVVVLLVLLAITALKHRRGDQVIGGEAEDDGRIGVQFPTESEDEDLSKETENVGLQTIRTRSLAVVGWMVAGFLSVFVLGHIVGISVFLLAMYRASIVDSWRQSALYTFVNVALLILIFEVLLGAFLYDGLLFDAIGVSF